MKWEYLIVDLLDLSELRNYGNKEWELCSLIERNYTTFTPVGDTGINAVTNKTKYECIFKKPKQ